MMSRRAMGGTHSIAFRLAILFAALTGCSAAAAETQLSVMTFNIRYGTADDGSNSWEFRRETVANTIRRYAPDVIGMQECLFFQAQYLDEALPAYEHFGVGRNPNGTSERMEIFYRSEVLVPIETGNFWLSETPDVPGSRDWESANIRMVTWARFYHLQSRRFFYHLNTHFDHRSELARQNAARLLAKFTRKLPKGCPIVITGDFNADAERSEVWRILEKRLEDAWVRAKLRIGPEVTWSGFKSPEDSVKRIDWILYRGPLAITHCETVLYNEMGRYPSDHYPVFTKFVFGK